MPELAVKQRSYTEEEITRGLTEVAIWAGNTTAAARALAEQGHPIPRETLRDWIARTHVDRYQTIRRDYMPRVHDAMATMAEDRYVRQATLEAKLEDHLEANLHELKPAETSGALRNATVSKKLNFDIATLSRGRPTQIVEQRNPEQILKQLAQRYGGAVDSTASEIHDAEVVDEAVEAQPLTQATSPDRAKQRTQ